MQTYPVKNLLIAILGPLFAYMIIMLNSVHVLAVVSTKITHPVCGKLKC